jgi:hypothetical protein
MIGMVYGLYGLRTAAEEPRKMKSMIMFTKSLTIRSHPQYDCPLILLPQ